MSQNLTKSGETSIRRVFKISILRGDETETIAIRPHIKSFTHFKEEIFNRMPQLKNKDFKIFYHGKSMQ